MRIALATTVSASRSKVYDVLRSTEGQKAFWTTDCELDDYHGRFSFAEAPVDLIVSISLVAEEPVRMKVDSGFPNWNGSTWEWALSSDPESSNETSVQFRHYDFESGYRTAAGLLRSIVGHDPRSTRTLREKRRSRALLH